MTAALAFSCRSDLPPVEQNREIESVSGGRSWAEVRLVEEKKCGYFVRAHTTFDGQLSLPLSHAFEWMSDGAPIVISKSTIFVDGQALVALRDGRIPEDALDAGGVSEIRAPLRAWVDRLRAKKCEEPEWPMAIVFADADVRASTVMEVLDTAVRCDFQLFALAVRTDAQVEPFSAALSMSRAPSEAEDIAALERGPHLNVVVDHDGVTIWTGRDDAERIGLDSKGEIDVERVELAAAERAASLSLGDASFPTVIFATAGHATMGTLVSVLSALAGRDCGKQPFVDGDRVRCKFPFRVFDQSLRAPSTTGADGLAR